MKRRQPREGWKSKFLRILISGSPNTGWKNKKYPVGRFSFSDPCVRENRGKREGNRGIQTATNRERQHWCVEVRLWDSEATTRQCGRHKEREERERASPLKTSFWVQQSIEFEENKVQGAISLSFSRLFTPNPRPTQLQRVHGYFGHPLKITLPDPLYSLFLTLQFTFFISLNPSLSLLTVVSKVGLLI